MVSTDNGPASVFVAGYKDLTDEEFAAHYRPELNKAIDNSSSFLLSDEAGACLKTFEYLRSRNVSSSIISVYANEGEGSGALRLAIGTDVLHVHSVPGGDTERYAMMLEKSDSNIIWLRSGDSLKDHGCFTGNHLWNRRFTGVKEAMRAVESKRYQEFFGIRERLMGY